MGNGTLLLLPSEKPSMAEHAHALAHVELLEGF